MKWFLTYEGALFVASCIDEMQQNQDYLPHWLKAVLPMLGIIGMAIRWRLAKKGVKLAK